MKGECTALRPLEFNFKGSDYKFTSTKIYHCLDDNSRYVVGVFSYNHFERRWIRFRQRRLKNNKWGSFISTKFEVLGVSKDFVTFPLGKTKGRFLDIEDAPSYLPELWNENQRRLNNGLKEFKPLHYEKEVWSAQKEIIWLTFDALRRQFGPKNDVEVSEIYSEYDKRFKKFEDEFKNMVVGAFYGPPIEDVVFSVKCLDDDGYEGLFVCGGVYSATDVGDEMFEVSAADGSKHRLFADRFVKL